MNGKQYQILGEINRQQRNTPLDLKSIYVRSDAGEMIQLDNLVTLKEDVAPPQLYRYNRFVSATVSSLSLIHIYSTMNERVKTYSKEDFIHPW